MYVFLTFPFSGSVLKYHTKCMFKLSPVLSLARLNYYYFTLGPLRLTMIGHVLLIPLLFSVTQWDIIENELLEPKTAVNQFLGCPAE